MGEKSHLKGEGQHGPSTSSAPPSADGGHGPELTAPAWSTPCTAQLTHALGKLTVFSLLLSNDDNYNFLATTTKQHTHDWGVGEAN